MSAARTRPVSGLTSPRTFYDKYQLVRRFAMCDACAAMYRTTSATYADTLLRPSPFYARPSNCTDCMSPHTRNWWVYVPREEWIEA